MITALLQDSMCTKNSYFFTTGFHFLMNSIMFLSQFDKQICCSKHLTMKMAFLWRIHWDHWAHLRLINPLLCLQAKYVKCGRPADRRAFFTWSRFSHSNWPYLVIARVTKASSTFPDSVLFAPWRTLSFLYISGHSPDALQLDGLGALS